MSLQELRHKKIVYEKRSIFLKDAAKLNHPVGSYAIARGHEYSELFLTGPYKLDFPRESIFKAANVQKVGRLVPYNIDQVEYLRLMSIVTSVLSTIDANLANYSVVDDIFYQVQDLSVDQKKKLMDKLLSLQS